MRKRKDPERILEFLGELRDCLLIVEGKKDERSLNTLGLTNILAINGRPLMRIVDILSGRGATHRTVPERDGVHRSGSGRIQHSEIIVLTDFDREGRHIAARLQRLLRAHKIHPNQRLRSRIMEFGFNKVEDITMDSVMALGRADRKGKRGARGTGNASGGRSLPKERNGRGGRSLPKERNGRGDDNVKASADVNEVRHKGFDKGQRSGGEA